MAKVWARHGGTAGAACGMGISDRTTAPPRSPPPPAPPGVMLLLVLSTAPPRAHDHGAAADVGGGTTRGSALSHSNSPPAGDHISHTGLCGAGFGGVWGEFGVMEDGVTVAFFQEFSGLPRMVALACGSSV